MARGKPFEPGNKIGRGRPRGSRNRSTLLAQELLNSYSDRLIRKCILMAMNGDPTAMRLCMDRILPPRRELPVKIGKLPTRTAEELFKASETLTQKVTAGELTPGQGQAFAELLARRGEVIVTHDIDQRVRAIEAQQ